MLTERQKGNVRPALSLSDRRAPEKNPLTTMESYKGYLQWLAGRVVYKLKKNPTIFVLLPLTADK